MGHGVVHDGKWNGVGLGNRGVGLSKVQLINTFDISPVQYRDVSNIAVYDAKRNVGNVAALLSITNKGCLVDLRIICR